MGKFLVTSGTSFRPFSYQELAAPVQQAAEIHRQTQDVYDSLGMETAALQRYIDQESEDSMARKMYEDYLGKLTTLQDNLWSNGYNAQTRRDLAAAKAGYAGDIARLQQAVKDRQERSAKYWDIKISNPDRIMGKDPGLGSLDDYVRNDLYGQNYFSYSGNQLAKEVSADAAARMKEVLDDPQLRRFIPGYYTFQDKAGFTSQNVSNAIKAIQDKYNGDVTSYESLDFASKILADVMDSHVQSTGAYDSLVNGGLDRDEFDRLLNYAGSGLSSSIGETKYQHMEDWITKMEKDFDIYKRKWDLDNPQPPQIGYGDIDELLAQMKLDDSYTHSIAGRNNEAMNNKLGKQVKELPSTIFYNGNEIRNNLDASALMYNEQDRIDSMSRFGFDYGMTHSKKHPLTGEIRISDDEVYDVWFNPDKKFGDRKGALMIKPKGDRGEGVVFPELTNEYYQKVNELNTRVEWFKKNRPDIADAANITPDERYKMYNNTGSEALSLSTPLSDYESSVVSLPGNGVNIVSDIWTARAGSDDANYREKVGDYMALSFRWNGDEIMRDPTWRVDTGQATGIHGFDINSGTLDENPIKDPKKMFEFDNDGHITNISGVTLTYDGIDKGYLVLYLNGVKQKAIGVGLDVLMSDKIRGQYIDKMIRYNDVDNNQDLTEEDKWKWKFYYAQLLSQSLRRIIGIDDATKKASATGN